MAIIQNDGKRERRRPSLKGGVMLDVVNGQERARSWPKKRGKPKSQKTADQNEWFRQAQWATKFMPAEMYWQIADAVKGTPLLPRDILTMMMAGRLLAFTMPNGRTMWSVQVANDVSQALDVIADLPGSMLVRGADRWMAILPGNNGQVLTASADGLPPLWADGGGGGGSGIIAGEGPPTNDVGELGQFYLDTAGNALWGPKKSIPAPITNKRYWGMVIYDCLATEIPSCAEMQFFAPDGDAVVPVSANMISQNPTYPSSRMINGDLSDFALTNRSGAIPREVFWFDFNVGVTVDRIRFYRRNDSYGYNEAAISVGIFGRDDPPVSPWSVEVVGTRSLDWGSSHAAGVIYQDIIGANAGSPWAKVLQGV